MKQSRRTFITKSTALAAAAAVPFANTNAMSQSKPALVHHVFFWLKNPSSKEDLNKLIEGVKSLAKIESIRALHVGVPAATEKRPVVDSSYAVSELIFFDDLAGQSAYQEHPIHKKFAAEYSYLWEKVVVYDSMNL